jgi:glutamine synthetase
MDVLTPVEMHARHEIELDKYVLKIQVESRIIGDLAQNHIIPTVVNYQNRLITNVKGLIDIFGEKEGKAQAAQQIRVITEISDRVNQILVKVDEMIEERKNANNIEHAREKAIAYCDRVRPYFEEIRYHVDKLEICVDDELWPLPKMREMLYAK